MYVTLTAVTLFLVRKKGLIVIYFGYKPYKSNIAFHKKILRVFSQLFTKYQCTSVDTQWIEEERMNFAVHALVGCCTVSNRGS